MQFPGEWGQSSRKGELEGAKLGFSFTVEFSANAAYFFSGWEAVLTDDLEDYLLVSENREDREEFNNKTENPEEKTKLVDITEIKDAKGKLTGRAKITVNSTRALTLVPHCYRRPYIKTTNLPNNFYDAKVKNYPINLYFSRNVSIRDRNFVTFGGITNQGTGTALIQNVKENYALNKLNENDTDGVSIIKISPVPVDDMKPYFSNLGITMNLDTGKIYWKSPEGDDVSMNPDDPNRELIYSIHTGSYSTAPTAQLAEAVGNINGALVSGVLDNDEMECYASNEDGELVVYILFDKDQALDSQAKEYGVTFSNTVRITEGSAEGPATRPWTGGLQTCPPNTPVW